jgi:hypothetical protein
MCGGGRAKRATIREPDYRAYDQMANMQFQAMRQAQDQNILMQQSNLNQRLSEEAAANAELRDLKVQEASNISAESARIAALIGTPPPDRGATAPVLGRDRSSSASVSRGTLRTSPRGSLRLGAPTRPAPTGGV